MKYDVFTLILDSNSALTKDAEAFRSTVSEYTRGDSTVLIISANSSVDRVIAGVAPQSLAAVPKLTNSKTKGDHADRVFSWIIEAQYTREAEGKASQALGVLYDCNSSSDSKLLEGLKAKRELSVIESSPSKKPQSVEWFPSRLSHLSTSAGQPIKQKTWRDFTAAFVAVSVVGILLGALLGLFGGYYIGLYYPGVLFGESVQEIVVSPSEVVLELGRTAQLVPQIVPKGAAGVALSYTSSDEDVAAVSETGLVTATLQGADGQDRIATITVAADNGVTADIPVTVKDSYFAYHADETIEYNLESVVVMATPILFQHMVPRCVGFTVSYTVSEIHQGSAEDFEGQKFLVLGRTGAEDDWIELGTFDYGQVDQSTTVEITFQEINLAQVICVRAIGTQDHLSWNCDVQISELRYNG